MAYLCDGCGDSGKVEVDTCAHRAVVVEDGYTEEQLWAETGGQGESDRVNVGLKRENSDNGMGAEIASAINIASSNGSNTYKPETEEFVTLLRSNIITESSGTCLTISCIREGNPGNP